MDTTTEGTATDPVAQPDDAALTSANDGTATVEPARDFTDLPDAQTQGGEDDPSSANDNPNTPANDVEAPKPAPESQSAARRRRRREAQQRDAEKIKAQQAEIARLKAERDAYQTVDPEQAEDYDAAVADNAAARALKARAQRQLTEAEQDAANAAERAQASLVADLISEGISEGMADFREVVFAPDVPFLPDTAAAIKDGSIGPRTAYLLAEDRNKLAELNRMTPFDRTLAIAEMERASAAPKPPTQTNAPAPITPGQGNLGSAAKDPTKMSFAEYEAAREAGQL